MRPRRALRGSSAPIAVLALVSCSPAPPLALPSVPSASPDAGVAEVLPAAIAPPSCGAAACPAADALLKAAQAFSHIRHDYLFETASAMEPGRGLEKLATGAYAPVGVACAKPRGAAGAAPPAAPTASTPRGREIDFRYVGLAIDSLLVGADVDLAAYFSAGGSLKTRKLKLVALALVRDEDPQFYEATDEVTPAGKDGSCTCSRATHFVGAVKYGAMIAYEMDLTGAEAHGSAMGLLKAELAKGNSSARVTSVGGLRLEGLSSKSGAEGPGELRFEVTEAVPIAYSLYPVEDVCRFALPEPEISPVPLEFGVVPYGQSAQRQLRVVNRAPLDLLVEHGDQKVSIPAFGNGSLSFSWTPEGEGARCEHKDREEEILIRPKDPSLKVTPKERRLPVPMHLWAGMPTFSKHEPLDTGLARAPEYDKVSADWSCPPGYVLESCEAQLERCASSNGTCHADGYRLSAEEVEGKGCRFRCAGPSSTLFGDHRCSYTAAMVCRLSCQ